MTTNRKRSLRRIGLISAAGLIAISASALPCSSAFAGSVSADQQIAAGQGQQKNPPPPSQQQNQKNWRDPACRANLVQCTFAGAAWRPGDRGMVVM